MDKTNLKACISQESRRGHIVKRNSVEFLPFMGFMSAACNGCSFPSSFLVSHKLKTLGTGNGGSSRLKVENTKPGDPYS